MNYSTKIKTKTIIYVHQLYQSLNLSLSLKNITSLTADN